MANRHKLQLLHAMTLAMATTLVISMSKPTYAMPEGSYALVYGGAAFPSSIDISTAPFPDAILDTRFKTGFNVGLKVGFKCGVLRYEGELLFLNADIRNVSPTSDLLGIVDEDNLVGASGDGTAYAGLFNVLYDFNEWSEGIQPYVGLGLGYGHVKVKLSAINDIPIDIGDITDNGFAYQFIIGSALNLDDYLSLTLDYRFFSTTGLDMGPATKEHFDAHLITIGLVSHFG